MNKEQIENRLKEIEDAIENSIKAQQQHMANHNALLGMQMEAKNFLSMIEATADVIETVVDVV